MTPTSAIPVRVIPSRKTDRGTEFNFQQGSWGTSLPQLPCDLISTTPYGGIIITASLGLLGVLLNAFLKRVRAGEEERPSYRMPGAPFTNYISLAFFAIVVASNVTSTNGRWTLALFGVVVVAMVCGWYAIRGKFSSNDEAPRQLGE